MFFIQLLLAVVAVSLVGGFAFLIRLTRAQFAAQQKELAALRDDMARLTGDADDGELLRIVRELHVVLKPGREASAPRRREDDGYDPLSAESRWERDWKRAFETDR